MVEERIIQPEATTTSIFKLMKKYFTTPIDSNDPAFYAFAFLVVVALVVVISIFYWIGKLFHFL